jgi:predicted transcriptional regulator
MENLFNKISDSELEILKVIWEHNASMTDKEIRDALKKESLWKRTTIQTFIKRMVDKGILLKEKRDVFYYSPAVSASELAKTRTEDLLNKVFGGDAKNLISAMLNNNILSEDDLDDVQNYWRGVKNNQ